MAESAVGAIIKRAMRSSTHAEVAERAGISRTYLSEIIIGRRRLSVRAARALGGALSIEPRRLLIAQVDEELGE